MWRYNTFAHWHLYETQRPKLKIHLLLWQINGKQEFSFFFFYSPFYETHGCLSHLHGNMFAEKQENIYRWCLFSRRFIRLFFLWKIWLCEFNNTSFIYTGIWDNDGYTVKYPVYDLHLFYLLIISSTKQVIYCRDNNTSSQCVRFLGKDYNNL